MKKTVITKFKIVNPQTVSEVANMCARNTFSLFCDITRVENLTKRNHRKVVVGLVTMAIITGVRLAHINDQIIELDRKFNKLRDIDDQIFDVQTRLAMVEEKLEDTECNA